MPQGSSTRWCPTPEQLMILEGMYKGSIRTPNAPQIQQITSLLSRYGKIEGKNVFYWFQNHKARDRLKLRRRLHRHQLLLQQQHYQSLAKTQLLHLRMELSHPPQQPHLNHSQAPSQFLHQEIYQEHYPLMNLLCKLDGREREVSTSMATSGYHGEGSPSVKDACLSNASCCRPIETLDLFPTKSTGLKEACRISGTSPCSTSITN